MLFEIYPVQLWWLTSLTLAVMFVTSVSGQVLDKRQLDGDNVWTKPSKFALSLAIHFATLAALGTWLSPEALQGAVPRMAAWIVVAATVVEMAYIIIQAARQKRSHFNLDTPLLRLLYAGMAIGAVIITLAAGWIGVALVIDGPRAPGPASLVGAQIGLIAGTILTLITAFRIGGTLERFVGGVPVQHQRMPLTGWSLQVGDRRVAHFLATHMMQSLPLLGLAAELLLPGWAALALVCAGAGTHAALVLAAYRLAERGKPFFGSPCALIGPWAGRSILSVFRR